MTVQNYHIRGSSASEISRSIEEGIRTGRLERGELLPSIRALAELLSVSPVTVASAYKSLRQRGMVATGGRRGTQVANRPPLGVHALPPPPAGARNLYDGNPDPSLLPSLRTVMATLPDHSRLYDELPAFPGLAEYARASLRADGIPAEALTVVGGAFDAIERVLFAQLPNGDRVAIEDPGFHRSTDLLASLGMIPEPVRIDEFGPVPASLAQAIKRGARALIITPRAQNPMGAALDAKRAKELRAIIAREPDFLVIEDDHAGAIAGTDHHTLIDGKHERWAVVRSYSKILAPDLRCSVLTGDEETIARVEGRLSVGPGWVSYLLQRLTLGLLEDPVTQKKVREANKAYAQRRKWMLDALARNGIEAYGRSGLNVWIPVRDEQRVIQSLANAGYALRAGEPFRLDAPPAVRITISTITKLEADAVADELGKVLRARSLVSSA